MTVSNSSSQITLATNGSTGPFAFPFIGVSSADISVSSITSNGSVASLLSSQYTLTLNAANPNALWGVGGSVLLSSTPSYPNLLIQRNIPLTQQTSVQNQGNYYAQVTEQALDILCMEIQQVSARTTQFRGQWTTNTLYSVGDIVQDGPNGADTLNYYICEVANTSGTWSTDLANGDWAISVLAVVPSTNKNITLSGDVSGSGTTGITTTLATVNSNVGTFTNPTITANGKGLITAISNGTPVAGNTIGLVNKFRNGTMDVWQRGTSGTVTTGNANYTADGWIVGATGATVSWAQSTDLQTVSPCNFSLKLTGATSMTDTFIRQRIESNIAAQLIDNPGAVGGQVTVQWYVYNGTGGNLTPTLTVKHPTVKDNYGSTVTDISAVSLPTIANMFEGFIAYTFAASASSYLGLEITLDLGSALNSGSNTFYMTAADIRPTPGVTSGINSIPPSVELRPIGVELAFCQRYLPAFGGTTGIIGMGAGVGSGGGAGIVINFPVSTRIAPTGISITTVGDVGCGAWTGAFGAASSLSFYNATTLCGFIEAVQSGLTSNTPYAFGASTALAGNLLFTGAEL